MIASVNLPFAVLANEYKFLVTELYSLEGKDIYTSYRTILPAKAVKVEADGDEFKISVDSKQFPSYTEGKYPLDVMIYPVLKD